MVDTNNLPLSNNCNFEMYFCIESFAKKEMSQRSKRAKTYFIFSSIYFLCADFCKICKRSTKQSKLLYNSLKTKSLSLALFIGFESLINSNALLKCYHSLLRTHSDQSHEIRHPIALLLCTFALFLNMGTNHTTSPVISVYVPGFKPCKTQQR